MTGLIYGFSLWMVTWLSYPHASVWALVPWALLAAERVLRRPSPRSAALLALVIGIQFLCGHPESSFHLCVAVAVFAVLRLRGSPAPRRRCWRWPAARSWGAALAALVLLPVGELVLRSADLEQRAGEAQNIKTPLKFALGVMVPFQWGKPTQTPIDFFLLARAFYGGALPLMLAAIALLPADAGTRGDGDRRRRLHAGRARDPAGLPDRHAPAGVLERPQHAAGRALPAVPGAARGLGAGRRRPLTA